MKMKLYEILKNFVEKEAHIRMPKLEKCEYFEMTGIYHDDTMSEWCSDNNKQCENCKNHSCYQTYIESISIEHKNEKRKIFARYDTDEHEIYLSVRKYREYDEDVFISRNICEYISWGG